MKLNGLRIICTRVMVCHRRNEKKATAGLAWLDASRDLKRFAYNFSREYLPSGCQPSE